MKKLILLINIFLALTLSAEVMAGLVPTSDAFRVHSSITGTQYNARIGVAANGDYVVVWNGTDGSTTSVFAKKYDRCGNVLIPEFKVSAEGSYHGIVPDVAVRPDGSFVIAWQRQYYWDNYARVYDEEGQGGDIFMVNTTTGYNEYPPKIALAPNGSFLITWHGRYYVDYGFGRRFEKDGDPIDTSDFSINSSGQQASPSAAFQNDGSFVVTWHEYESPSNIGIFARIFDSNLNGGTVFQVNSEERQNDLSPFISMEPDDSFTIIWKSIGSPAKIYSHRFKSDGSEWDPENTDDKLLHEGSNSSSSTTGDGTYIIASLPSGAATVRRYEQDGTAIGDPITVSTSGSISAFAGAAYDGSFVAVFVASDGDSYGVFVRQYKYQCGS